MTSSTFFTTILKSTSAQQ